MTRRQRSKTHPAANTPRPRKRQADDPDAASRLEKPPEPAACPRCGAVLREGRWQWASGGERVPARACPACRRIAEDLPDGIVTIAGGLAAAHEAEIRSLVAHVEENEKREHPLVRCFGIAGAGPELVVKTTERRLADSIARALERAYDGALERHEGDRSTPLRVRWERD